LNPAARDRTRHVGNRVGAPGAHRPVPSTQRPDAE